MVVPSRRLLPRWLLVVVVHCWQLLPRLRIDRLAGAQIWAERRFKRFVRGCRFNLQCLNVDPVGWAI